MAFPLQITFGNNKKHKKPIQHKTVKEKSEQLKYRKEKAETQIEIEVLEEARHDPEWRRVVAFKRWNIELPKPPSLLEQKRAEFAEKVLSQVNFDEDEELRERAHEWVANNMFVDTADGKAARRPRRDHSEGGVGRIMEDLEGVREIAETLGYKESGNSWLRDLAPAIAPILMQLLSSRQDQGGMLQLPTPAPQALPAGQAQPIARVVPVKAEVPQPVIKEIPTYIIMMPDGSTKRMNEGEYQQWIRSQQAAPKPAQAVPAQPMRMETQRQESAQPADRQSDYTMNVPIPEMPIPEEKPMGKTEPSRSYVISVGEAEIKLAGQGSLGLESWIPYLDRPPEDFVEEVQQRSYEDASFRFLLDTLRNSNGSAQILSMLAPYKQDPKYGPIIAQLEKHTQWIDGVIAYARENSGPYE